MNSFKSFKISTKASRGANERQAYARAMPAPSTTREVGRQHNTEVLANPVSMNAVQIAWI